MGSSYCLTTSLNWLKEDYRFYSQSRFYSEAKSKVHREPRVPALRAASAAGLFTVHLCDTDLLCSHTDRLTVHLCRLDVYLCKQIHCALWTQTCCGLIQVDSLCTCANSLCTYANRLDVHLCKQAHCALMYTDLLCSHINRLTVHLCK